MPCPVCSHTMASIADGVFHCPRCGCAKVRRDGYSEAAYIPKWTEQVDGVSLYHRLLAACSALTTNIRADVISSAKAFLAKSYYPGEMLDARERVRKADGDCYGL